VDRSALAARPTPPARPGVRRARAAVARRTARPPRADLARRGRCCAPRPVDPARNRRVQGFAETGVGILVHVVEHFSYTWADDYVVKSGPARTPATTPGSTSTGAGRGRGRSAPASGREPAGQARWSASLPRATRWPATVRRSQRDGREGRCLEMAGTPCIASARPPSVDGRNRRASRAGPGSGRFSASAGETATCGRASPERLPRD